MTTIIPFQQQNDIFQVVQDFSEYLKMSPEEQESYDRKLDKVIVYKNTLEYELEKGIEIGREEGMTEGVLKTARSMKQNNIDYETIMKCTNLSLEEIERL